MNIFTYFLLGIVLVSFSDILQRNSVTVASLFYILSFILFLVSIFNSRLYVLFLDLGTKPTYFFSFLFFLLLCFISLANQNYLLFNSYASSIHSFFSLFVLFLFLFVCASSLDSSPFSSLDRYGGKFLFLASSLVIFFLFLTVLENIFLSSSLGSSVVCNEHVSRSFYDQQLSLFCGWFDSSKKLARYSYILYLFHSCCFLLLAVSRNISIRLNLVFRITTFFSLLNVASSNSREAFYSLIPLIIVIFFSVQARQDILSFLRATFFSFFRKLTISKTVIYFSLLLVTSILIVSFFLDADIYGLNYVFFIDDDSLSDRLLSFFPLSALLGSTVLFGNGLGVYGQEARSYGDSAAFDLIQQVTSLTSAEASTILDSGILKILIELGAFGVLLFTIIFLFAVASNFVAGRDFVVLSLFVLAFLIMKLHLVLSDPFFVGSYLYLTLVLSRFLSFDNVVRRVDPNV